MGVHNWECVLGNKGRVAGWPDRLHGAPRSPLPHHLKHLSTPLPACPCRPRMFCSCYSLSWEDVVGIGPTRVIVRRGADTRAIKENEGIVDEGISLLVQLVVGPDGDKKAAGAPAKKAAGDESYR